MTAPKPQWSPQISLGNVIQICILLVGLAGAWFAMDQRTNTAQLAAQKNAAELAQVELRVRSLETKNAADSEQLRTLQRDIADLKQGQRETNGLLRQLLQRGSLDQTR